LVGKEKKKVPDGGGVLRWSEGVREFGGGFVGMVRGGRTVLGVGGGGGVGVGSGNGGVGREVRWHVALRFKFKVVSSSWSSCFMLQTNNYVALEVALELLSL
jgi:hypothetical protein